MLIATARLPIEGTLSQAKRALVAVLCRARRRSRSSSDPAIDGSPCEETSELDEHKDYRAEVHTPTLQKRREYDAARFTRDGLWTSTGESHTLGDGTEVGPPIELSPDA